MNNTIGLPARAQPQCLHFPPYGENGFDLLKNLNIGTLLPTGYKVRTGITQFWEKEFPRGRTKLHQIKLMEKWGFRDVDNSI